MAKQQTTSKPAAKKSTKVSNEIRLDAKNPIPFDGGRAFSFVNNTEYLPFLDGKDDFGQQLLECRILSATHNRCVVSKANYCAGDGFMDTDGNELPTELTDWLASMNMKNEAATELTRRMLEDIFTWGNVPIEIVRFKSAGKKYVYVYVHNFLEWRLGKPDEDDIVQYAIQSKLFLRNQRSLTPDEISRSKKLPLYNPRKNKKDNWYQDDKGVERTLIWLKNSVSGFSQYGLPSAIASMIYQLLEYKGARYNLDNFDNNMVVSALLAIKGNISQTEADRIGKKAIQTHTGDGKRGRVMVVASEEGIEGSDLHTFDTQKEGSFKDSDDKWMQKIILANEWDAVLAGIQSASTMGKGSGFLTKIIEHINRTVILPAQKKLMTTVWSHIFTIAGEWMDWDLKKFNLAIKSNIDISGLTDVDITPAVTVDEVREAKGLPRDGGERGKKYLGELKVNQQQKKGGDNVQD
ncbi:phage portal family protein [Chitinophaga tropicalis]|uniref:Portal protein n=1 Tax=Chitinophaga tropicalis TaxID=2683588 RepID=A0A7K1UAI3_9BACT|nr:hypothetical protein [Chitinophaga tropicalis]MVT11384.1 hypothetical protein [Chitinophaga tropicalis]